MWYDRVTRRRRVSARVRINERCLSDSYWKIIFINFWAFLNTVYISNKLHVEDCHRDRAPAWLQAPFPALRTAESFLWVGFMSPRNPGVVNAFDQSQHLLRTVSQKITQRILSEGFGFRKGKVLKSCKTPKLPSVSKSFHWNKAWAFSVARMMLLDYWITPSLFSTSGFQTGQVYCTSLCRSTKSHLIRGTCIFTKPNEKENART